jgi:hypothetical protein
VTAGQRDRIADARDEAGHARDARAADVARRLAEHDASMTKQLEELGARAAADRANAARERRRIWRMPLASENGSRQNCARPTSTT